MPIFDYKCKKCENEFTKLVFSKNEEVECPECQSNDVDRKVSKIGSVSTSSSSTGGGCCGPSSSGFS